MKTKADNNGPFKEFMFDDWLREGFDGFCGQIKSERIDTSQFETVFIISPIVKIHCYKISTFNLNYLIKMSAFLIFWMSYSYIFY